MRALAIAGLGRVPEAVDLVTEELDLARRWGAHMVIGMDLRLLGDLRGDVALLQESVAVLDIHTEMARAGVDIPDAPPAAAILTRTERRIATLSANGADEREIAQSLFITPRSVQRTLEAVRSALGVRSRLDLRRALVSEVL